MRGGARACIEESARASGRSRRRQAASLLGAAATRSLLWIELGHPPPREAGASWRLFPPYTPTPRAALFYLQSEVAHTRLFLSPRKGVESRWSGSRIGAEFEGGRQGAKDVSPQRPEKARANLSDDDGRRTTGRVRAESHQPWRAFGRCCRTRHRRESISQSKARASQIKGVARDVAEQQRTTAGGAGLDTGIHVRTLFALLALSLGF